MKLLVVGQRAKRVQILIASKLEEIYRAETVGVVTARARARAASAARDARATGGFLLSEALLSDLFLEFFETLRLLIAG